MSKPQNVFDHRRRLTVCFYRLREEVATDGATTIATQESPVTVIWQETEIAPGVTTYVPTTFTQSFVAVPDQLPSAGSGTIALAHSTSGTPAVKTHAADEKTSGSAEVANLRGLLDILVGAVTSLMFSAVMMA